MQTAPVLPPRWSKGSVQQCKIVVRRERVRGSETILMKRVVSNKLVSWNDSKPGFSDCEVNFVQWLVRLPSDHNQRGREGERGKERERGSE
jgi:hypothetical protein